MQAVPAASLATRNPILIPCGIIVIIGVRTAANDASKYLIAITQGSAGAIERHAADAR
ncbi:MAG: hypothetical protein QOJ45_1110 [Verrucomicrobiota bacterium]